MDKQKEFLAQPLSTFDLLFKWIYNGENKNIKVLRNIIIGIFTELFFHQVQPASGEVSTYNEF